MKNAFLATFAALLLALVLAQDMTITQILTASGSALDKDGSDFDILLSLVQDAGLGDTLGNTRADFTVFAPDDKAFIDTAIDLGFTEVSTEKEAKETFTQLIARLDGDSKKNLRALLLYHVVEGNLKTQDILVTTELKTVQGETIRRGQDGDPSAALLDKSPDIPSPQITKFDTIASNGVVHTINRVLFYIPASKEIIDGLPPVAAGDVLNPDSETTPEGTADVDEEDDDDPCFPASANVHMADGSEMPISKLQAGHFIKTDADSHSQVFLFTHRQLEGLHEFVRVEAASGHVITLSANHYVYANGKLTAGDSVKIGDVLTTTDGPSKVVKLSTVMEHGLVAPHTLHGDILVNGVKASSYTRSVHPTVAHALLAPVRALVHMGIATEPLGSFFYDGADRMVKYMPSGF